VATSDDQTLVLHDRVTRGQPLSPEERARLDAWYADQDQAEMNMLRSNPEADTVVRLQHEIGVVLTRLADVGIQIKELAAQNDALRRENALLQHQVSTRLASEVA